MTVLFIKAFLRLVQFDLYIVRGNFAALHRRVRNFKVGQRVEAPGIVERICSVVDLACIWYPKQVLCLQRSAATTCLLRSYGVPARLVIGAQKLPFKAHAWVELEDRVVNDKPLMAETYAVLDRC